MIKLIKRLWEREECKRQDCHARLLERNLYCDLVLSLKHELRVGQYARYKEELEKMTRERDLYKLALTHIAKKAVHVPQGMSQLDAVADYASFAIKPEGKWKKE